MNIIRQRAGAILMAGSLLFSLAAGAEHRPAGYYVVRDLGTLPGGHYSVASRINNRGEIAGISDNGTTAVPFLYTPDGRMHELPMPPGINSPAIWDLNDRGQVLAYTLWPATIGNVGITDTTLLADLFQVADVKSVVGQPLALGFALNNLGDIVGADIPNIDDFRYRPYLFSDGAYSLLDAGVGGRWMHAVDINDSRSGLSWAFVKAETQMVLHTFILSNGTMTDIGTLPGGNWTWGQRINNRGHVMGIARIGTNEGHSFFWQDGRMTDFGGTTFYDFNNHDEMLGDAGDGGPIIVTGGTQDEFTPVIVGLPRHQEIQLTGLNDAGEMVGSVTGRRETRAILITPGRAPDKARPPTRIRWD
jgi:probable HAF family extracellular repeat protein